MFSADVFAVFVLYVLVLMQRAAVGGGSPAHAYAANSNIGPAEGGMGGEPAAAAANSNIGRAQLRVPQ